MQAEIVATTLEDREGRLAAERFLQRLREAGKVAVDELALKCDRGRRDDDRGFSLDRVPDRGNEVRQRLSGARARLDGQVFTGADRAGDGLGHLDLAWAFGTAHGLHRVGQEFEDAGEVGSGGHSATLAAAADRIGDTASTGLSRRVLQLSPRCGGRRVSR